MKIPEIQPFQFIRGTAFSERVQLANKVNEIIDGINSIGEIPDIQAQIDTINSIITQIQTDIANTDTEISDIRSQVNTLIQEVNDLLSEVVNEIVVDSPGYGQVRVKLIHEDESETASNALQIPVIQDGGITLISGTTDRSFKIQYITMDGVTHTTNDFVIPEGGGTDVTITSISILQGDTPNDIKFQVGLSDGSPIQSNSYPIPQAAITPATTSQIGGIKVGTNLSVTADGTLSVDMTTIGTAAKADSIVWKADASKVTLHADSLNGSKFTKDIPQASQGGAGTIDQESYAKIAATETKVNALAPTVTVKKDVSPPQITVAINGKRSTADLPNGGGSGGWEEISISNIPTDFAEGDRIRIITNVKVDYDTPDSWMSEITSGSLRIIPNANSRTEIELTIGPEGRNTFNKKPLYLDCTGSPNKAMAVMYIYQIFQPSEWNATEGNPAFFQMSAAVWNGVSALWTNFAFARNNAASYILKFYRQKAN